MIDLGHVQTCLQDRSNRVLCHPDPDIFYVSVNMGYCRGSIDTDVEENDGCCVIASRIDGKGFKGLNRHD